MEYCQGGDLSHIIKQAKAKNNDYIDEDLIWKIFSQICLALRYCHSKTPYPIIHRDIKPANIFISNSNTVKLGDFGLSKMLVSESKYTKTHVGTPYYMSPEQINEEKYNYKSDIWSLGCIIYEAASLKPPFHAENFISLAVKIKKGKFERIPEHYSDSLQHVIEQMLSVDPRNRPSVVDLIQNNPLIRLKIREIKVKEKIESVNRKEEKLKSKEIELNELQKMLEERLSKVEEREKKVADLEGKYKAFVSNMVALISF